MTAQDDLQDGVPNVDEIRIAPGSTTPRGGGADSARRSSNGHSGDFDGAYDEGEKGVEAFLEDPPINPADEIAKANTQPLRSSVHSVVKLIFAFAILGLLCFMAYEVYNSTQAVAGPGAIGQPHVVVYQAVGEIRRGDVVAATTGGVIAGMSTQTTSVLQTSSLDTDSAVAVFPYADGSERIAWPARVGGTQFQSANLDLRSGVATTSSSTVPFNVGGGDAISIAVCGADAFLFVTTSPSSWSLVLWTDTDSTARGNTEVSVTDSAALAAAWISRANCGQAPGGGSVFVWFPSSGATCTVSLVATNGGGGSRLVTQNKIFSAACSRSFSIFGEYFLIGSNPMLVLSSMGAVLAVSQAVDLPMASNAVTLGSFAPGQAAAQVLAVDVVDNILTIMRLSYSDKIFSVADSQAVRLPLVSRSAQVQSVVWSQPLGVAMIMLRMATGQYFLTTVDASAAGLLIASPLPLTLPNQRCPLSFYSLTYGGLASVLVSRGNAEIFKLRWVGGVRTIGVALSDSSRGTVRVAVAGISPVHANLIPGGYYGVGTNASLTLTIPGTSMVVGRALSSTELLVLTSASVAT